MPSVEFLGYAKGEREFLEQTLRRDLADLEFSDQIMFVTYACEVRDMQGKSQPYLRICTRNEAKAKILTARLRKYADVEFIQSADFVVWQK